MLYISDVNSYYIPEHVLSRRYKNSTFCAIAINKVVENPRSPPHSSTPKKSTLSNYSPKFTLLNFFVIINFFYFKNQVFVNYYSNGVSTGWSIYYQYYSPHMEIKGKPSGRNPIKFEHKSHKSYTLLLSSLFLILKLLYLILFKLFKYKIIIF